MSRGRPKEFDPDAALGAAIEAFWQKGYQRTCIADLTRAMGIGRQSLYDTFGDKRQVFMAALDRYSEERFLDFKAGLEAAEDRLSYLRERSEGLARGEVGEPRGCLAMNALPLFLGRDPEVEALLKRHLDRYRDCIAQVFAEEQAEGRLACDLPPKTLAEGLMILIQGMSQTCCDSEPEHLKGAIAVSGYLLRPKSG
ncbi:MAG: TetR/AcrR family transcriptional regulator [Pseudomonadota bacterium]